ncbi:MAG: hypothetical protein O3C57_00250 [Verrucomicrobia bacterium]|nr:hypothetical protein [Verrucomicrobiota bacterium]
MSERSQKSSSLEEEVWNAIAAFEQILEAMPNDRASLEALCHAYEQIGDHTRAKDYAIRLCDVLMEDGDNEGAKALLDRLQTYADGDERVQQAFEKLNQIGQHATEEAGVDAGVRKARAVPLESRETPSFSLAEELSFAWSLLEADLLTQEEYGSLVQDLTELSSNVGNLTISVLHALEVRGFKHLERVLASVSKICGSPLINVASFDVPHSATLLLPYNFMLRRGVLVFDFIANDLLVVIMNPYDKQLRNRVEAMTGRACHFYMTMPSAFDATLEKIRQQQAKGSEA